MVGTDTTRGHMSGIDQDSERPVDADRPAHLPRAECDLSVALCTWNGARWIQPFLQSLVAQDLLPDELVVSDDASTDDTAARIREFARSAPFEVRLQVNERRLGSTDNFARVLERCRGRFIALADQDDVWYPAKLRRLHHELVADPTLTLAFSDADLIREDNTMIGRRLWDTRLVGRTLRRHPVVPEELFARRALTTGCTMVVRRRTAEAALPFPQVLQSPTAPMRHDRWLSLVAAAVGTVRAVPESLLGFRVHDLQETGVLQGSDLGRALVAVTGRVLGGMEGARSLSLEARAAQLLAAADRADALGDFTEARLLREIAAGGQLRAAIGGATGGGPTAVLRAARAGAYAGDPLLLAAVGADLVRSLRPGRSR